VPIKKSAKKFIRSTSTKTSRNNTRKKEFRVAVKKVLELIGKNKFKEAQQAFVVAQKALDKAAKSGVIKKNTASRKKSRLAKKLSSTKK